MRETLRAALLQPESRDNVYVAAMKLFKHKSELILARQNHDRPKRHAIRRLAWKRFILGYPPRKSNDTSIGDAINWEWIIDCATRTKRSVIIVSRDLDYGVRVGDEIHLNEWLAEEFSDRVPRKGAKIELTEKLSNAFERLNIRVTEQERKAEEKVIKERGAENWFLLDNFRLQFADLEKFNKQWEHYKKFYENFEKFERAARLFKQNPPGSGDKPEESKQDENQQRD
jgi:hypothetical protein